LTALAVTLAVLAATPPAAAEQTPGAAAPPAWQTLAPGAARATLKTDEGQPIELLRFDLEHFRAAVVVGKGQPPQARTAQELRQNRGAVAAVNGGFFDGRVVPLGLRIADGEQRFPLRPKADWGVLVLAGHRARIVHTREYPALPLEMEGGEHQPDRQGPDRQNGQSGIDGAIQVGPRLLVDGAPTKLRPQLARRTAVALDEHGRELTLVVVPEPADANEVAERLAAAGFANAMLLDGGPSTQASVELGDAHLEIAGGYPVPDLLAIFPRPAHRKVNTPTAAPAPPTKTTPRNP
jgi:hypothetical protein